MTDVVPAQVEVIVRPIRFTAHLPRMRDFLSLLGYSLHVSRAEDWATMVGGSGQVALHDTASTTSGSGETSLMFEVPAAEALATQLAKADLSDVNIFDEAWGRVLQVRGDQGVQLSFDERPTDWYGYRLDDPRPQHGIVSMPVMYGAPTGPLTRLFSAASLQRLDEGDDESWRVWSGPGGGLVALHAATDHGPAGTVRLAFRTQEPLRALAQRLTTAGYADVRLSDDEFGSALLVTDPDGQSVLVQPVR